MTVAARSTALRSMAGALLILATVLPEACLQAQAVERFHRGWSTDSFGLEPFFRPVGLLVTSPCQVWLADVGNAAVYRYGCDGTRLGRAGGRGEGPGEFNVPWPLAELPGGEVGVWDQPQGRVSVFDASGTFVRSAPMHVSPLVHGFVDAFGRSGDALLALTNNYPSIQPRPNESYSFLVPVDSAGNAGEPLLRMPAPGSVIERWGSASARIEAPFRRKPVVLFSPDGSVLVGNTGSRQFRRFAYGGRLTPTGDFSADLPSLAVTRAERRAWTDSIRNHLASERERAGLTGAAEREFARRHQRLLEAVQFPLNHAYYLTAAQDDLGRLWLQLPGRRGDRTVRWQVRDGRTGALRRIVEHPAGGRVVAAAVRGGVLFTIEIDGDGAGRLVSYAART